MEAHDLDLVPVRRREPGSARPQAWPFMDGRRTVAELAAILAETGAGDFHDLAHILVRQVADLAESGHIELVRGTPGSLWRPPPSTTLVVAATRQGPDAHEPDDDYRSGFAGWYERASVRGKPRRILEPGAPVYFSPELVPIAAHPVLLGKGESAVRQILVHRLFGYLHFTTELEQIAVIPVASAIARGRSGIHLPEQMRGDAYKIVTDEAWHAQFSYDLIRQVETETGTAVPELPVPAFVDRLEKIDSSFPESMRGLTALLFSIVSETLISATLSELPRDSRLPAAVREVVKDHAIDEGRHHSYFKEFLTRLWPELSVADRRTVGPALPGIIDAFLRPDPAALLPGLRAVGLTAEECRQVFAEAMPEELIRRDVAAGARPAVKYFTEVGVLEDPRTRDAFEAHELL
ncbi:diiron oxygenase [Symbioplanes lichenis]|uniref:diiron oxygenase n=1 Tax=Symbioplanes lichenis TaxID=1629072 RepID=UPI002739F058|nr:diiron oxygenase [Actinoplanes lichenis]